MNAFETCKQTEIRGMDDVMQFLRMRVKEGSFVLTNKGSLSQFLQSSVGDIVMNDAAKTVWGVELKCEESNRWGNFFLETWSNMAFGWQKVGWMYTLKTDVLLYYFIKEKELYSISFKKLFEWAHGTPTKQPRLNHKDFKFAVQSKYKQFNVTAGYCVPIDVIEKEVGFTKYPLRDPGTTQQELLF